jgi:glycosyltransferase involved in cell wall biosynthesis
VVGGVEAVMTAQARLFAEAGYPVTLVVGRGEAGDFSRGVRVEVIPDMDSEVPAALRLAARPDQATLPPEFFARRDRLEHALGVVLEPVDVVIVHNVLSTHFNLPLTAALHRLADRGLGPQLIAWCHDISRYVNPASGAPPRSGAPWDLLRRYRPEVTYVAVSSRRQHTLAGVLGCPLDRIRVVPNGVDPSVLLGLSPAGAQLAQLVEAFGLLSADLVMLMPVRITRAKNIEFAIKVSAALKAAGVRARLVISGPPDPHAPDREDYFAELQALRHSLAVDSEVIFAAEGLPGAQQPLALSSAGVAELLRLADLVLMPSHREGFGMPVLEAGLVGKPVFATAVPVVEELGDGLVQVIQPDEPAPAVANRIWAWAEADPRQRLRRRVRQTYTWSTIFSRDLQPLVANVAATRQGQAA